MNKMYSLSDKTVEMLNRKAARRFRTARAKTSFALKTDELNVMNAVTELYANLKSDNVSGFTELAYAAYYAAEYHGNKPPDRKWVITHMKEYDPVLLWVYWNEMDRKRDRATESILATRDKKREWDKALRLWMRSTLWASDSVAYGATVKALEDAGITYVRWKTQKDERVCKTCGPLHNKVFPISKLPPKPHPSCRCWFEAIKKK